MDDRNFRYAMGKFATGITVITTEVDGDIHGMTANAFMSWFHTYEPLIFFNGEYEFY